MRNSSFQLFANNNRGNYVSGQKQVDKHRVRLTHTVEESGAIQDVEIPFTMGILTDAYGNHPDSIKKSIDDSEFREINSHTFDKYLADVKPRMQISVPNHLSGVEGEVLNADIEITSMKNFSPDSVASSVGGLKEVYETRNKLEALLRHLEKSKSAKKIVDEALKGGGYQSLVDSLNAIQKDSGEPG